MPVRTSTAGKRRSTARRVWLPQWSAWPALARLVPPRLTGATPTLIWVWLAVVGAATAFMWIFGDSWWPATVLLFGPRWILLVPALPLAGAAALVRPRLLLVVGLGLIVTLGPMMGFHVGWRRWLGSSGGVGLRIITFNVGGSENPQMETVPAALELYHADAIVLQECLPRLIEPRLWPPGWTMRQSEGGLCFGSRFPILGVETLKRVGTGDQGGTGNAVLFRIQAGTDTIAIAGVHLETPRKGLSSLRNAGNASRMPVNLLIRDVGASRISRWLLTEPRALIIAGDFNMPVESRIYRRYFGDCTNVFSAIGFGFGWTRILKRFSARIDHVLICSGGRPVHIEIGPALGSDHRPVIVDLVRSH